MTPDFDFDAVRRHMKRTRWKWWFRAERKMRVPTVDELREALTRQIENFSAPDAPGTRRTASYQGGFCVDRSGAQLRVRFMPKNALTPSAAQAAKPIAEALMPPTRDTVYVLRNSQTKTTYLFTELAVARAVLRAKADRVRVALGTRHIRHEPNRLSWVFGWESVETVFWISEEPIIRDAAMIAAVI